MKKIGSYLSVEGLRCAAAAAPRGDLPGRAVIHSWLRCTARIKLLYIISLELDGHELVSSSRLALEPESAEIALPELFVINPLAGPYTVTLKIYAGGGEIHEFSETVFFGAPQ